MSALAWVSGFITCYSVMSGNNIWMIVGFAATIIFAFLDFALDVASNNNEMEEKE